MVSSVCRRSRRFIPILLLFLFSVALYVNTLKNGFVYDDVATIKGNYLIKDLNNFPKLFNKEYFSLSGEVSYRPVVTLTYFTDNALFGSSPWGFHLTNLLIHAVNGVLFYTLLTLLFRPTGTADKKLQSIPFLASLLFIAHPVLTEVVNAISYREDLLVFFFYISTLSLYWLLRSNSAIVGKPFLSNLLYFASCLTYLLALFSKEMAVTLPLVVYCIEWVYGDKSSARSTVNAYNTGYVAITFIYLYLYFYYFYYPAGIITPPWSFSERLLTVPWLLINYSRLTLLPISLSAEYDIVPIRHISSPDFFVPVILIIILFGLTFLMKKEKDITFGIFFFMITLMPVFNIIQLANPFAERYLYLPTAGFTFVAVLSMYRIASVVDRRTVFQGIVGISVFLFSILTVQRNGIWLDEFTLWTDCLKKVPNSARAHLAMGSAFAKRGMLDDAIREYKESIRLAPHPDLFYVLGLAYDRKGMEKEAIISYKKALRTDPSHRDSRYNLAVIYQDRGLIDEAINEYTELLRYKSDDYEALNNLGYAYSQKGLYEAAISQYERAIDIDPESVAPYNNIGMVYAVMGKTIEAKMWFKKGLKIDPESAETYYNLGYLYQNAGRLAEAADAYKKAIDIRPGYNEARTRLQEFVK